MWFFKFLRNKKPYPQVKQFQNILQIKMQKTPKPTRKAIWIKWIKTMHLNNFERFNFMQESYSYNFVPKELIKEINKEQPIICQ